MSRGAWRQIDDNARPVDHAVAAGTTDRSTGHLAAFGTGLLGGDILGVQVHQPVGHVLEPGIRIVAAEVGVARVKVDANGRTLHQRVDPIQSFGMLAVLLVGFQSDQNAAGSATRAASWRV